MPKKLSVIIVSYNDTKHLSRCISSLYQKVDPSLDWEIIIINNDKRQDIAGLDIDLSKIKILDHRKNVGFGSAINMGSKEATGEVLFILNPDTEIQTKNIPLILDNLSEDVGIIGGGVFDEKNNRQKWSAGREVSLYDLIRNNLGLPRSAAIWNSSQETYCDWVSGTNMFIEKDLFDQLGGFDENFFMYFEDMDLCRRARKAGKNILFFPEFQVYHGNGKSYESKKLQKKHYYDSMEKYFKKHYSHLKYLFIRLIRKFIVKK